MGQEMGAWGVGSLQLRTWQTLSFGAMLYRGPEASPGHLCPTGSLAHIVGLEEKSCVPGLV